MSMKQVMRLLSHRIRSDAGRRRVSYSFLFMRASRDQLSEIGALIDAAAIRPVVDRVYPFARSERRWPMWKPGKPRESYRQAEMRSGVAPGAAFGRA
jgi:hypothetical protein